VKLKVKALDATHNGKSFTMRFQGMAGEEYKIQVSSDFKNWNGILMVTADENGLIEFTDPDAGKEGTRYYRVVEP